MGDKTGKPGGETVVTTTTLAQDRTDLAMMRSYLASERTLMGWIRTTLAMISFGFTLGKAGQILHHFQVKGVLGKTRMLSVENVAYFLVILGTAALLGAVIQHRLRMHELFRMGLRRQYSITNIVAILLTLLGLFVLSSLVLNL